MMSDDDESSSDFFAGIVGLLAFFWAIFGIFHLFPIPNDWGRYEWWWIPWIGTALFLALIVACVVYVFVGTVLDKLGLGGPDDVD